MPGTAREALVSYAASIDAETNRIAAELAATAPALANAATVDEVNEIIQPVLDKLKAVGTVVPTP
jgi:hypothetical protein